MEAFKPGDTVRRIGKDWEDIKVGDIHVVESCVVGSSKPGIKVKGREKTYDATLFELVSREEDAAMALHDPVHQPFNYPETDEDRERATQAKLRAYKRGMRDWLYGTTSGE